MWRWHRLTWAGKSLARWNAPALFEEFFNFFFAPTKSQNTYYGSWVRNGGYSSNSKKANPESWVDHDVLPMGVCGGGLLIKFSPSAKFNPPGSWTIVANASRRYLILLQVEEGDSCGYCNNLFEVESLPSHISLLLIVVTPGEAGLLIECLKEVVSVFNVSISEWTFSLVEKLSGSVILEC